jgi:hypothetical protein
MTRRVPLKAHHCTESLPWRRTLLYLDSHRSAKSPSTEWCPGRATGLPTWQVKSSSFKFASAHFSMFARLLSDAARDTDIPDPDGSSSCSSAVNARSDSADNFPCRLWNQDWPSLVFVPFCSGAPEEALKVTRKCGCSALMSKEILGIRKLGMTNLPGAVDPSSLSDIVICLRVSVEAEAKLFR